MTTYRVSVLDNEHDELATLRTSSKSAMVDYVVGMYKLGYHLQSIMFVGNWLAVVVMVDDSDPHYPTQREEDHLGDLWIFSNRRELIVLEDSDLKW